MGEGEGITAKDTKRAKDAEESPGGGASRVEYGLWISGEMGVNCRFRAPYGLIGQNGLFRDGF